MVSPNTLPLGGNSLVILVNGAQIIIDQYLVAAEENGAKMV